MRAWIWAPLCLLAAAFTSACTHQAPTIAHVHIGHALTGWPETPDKEGFFVLAEKRARQALEAAQRATNSENTLERTKSAIDLVAQATSATNTTDEEGKRYGVKQALNEAIDHITFAADSDDATQNVQTSANTFARDAVAVLERCDLIVALANDIRTSSSTEDATVLAEEVLRLARANLYGEDSDGDGRSGAAPGEYGLAQLRAELDAMIAREDPPYTTVDTWYLFNLIRLPSGEWIFRERTSTRSDSGYGY